MILPDLPSPAEAGFAKAGNRFSSPIGVEDMFFGIMRLAGNDAGGDAQHFRVQLLGHERQRDQQ